MHASVYFSLRFTDVKNIDYRHQKRLISSLCSHRSVPQNYDSSETKYSSFQLLGLYITLNRLASTLLGLKALLYIFQ